MATSRPSTPAGLSPRGSFVNLADASEPGSPLFNNRLVDEKGRIRAELEAESHAALLRSEQAVKADRAKKEEVGMPVGSPGTWNSPSPRDLDSTGALR